MNPTQDVIPGADRFATTQWSLVRAAMERGTPVAAEALANLFRAYWYPLFAFVRRQGYHHADAQDLTQGFFAALLEKEFFAAADPGRGRFRSFLLGALKHYLSNQRRHDQAARRGGRAVLVGLEFDRAEQRLQNEPAHGLTPQQLFDRHWAQTLMDRVLAALQAEYAQTGREELFEALKGALTDPGGDRPYRETAAALGLSEGAVKVAVHRLRQRFRDRLRAEIAATVADPADVDEEIRALFQAVHG
jgi:RNA polymerase sigma-70 factor (ECF subfamily)